MDGQRMGNGENIAKTGKEDMRTAVYIKTLAVTGLLAPMNIGLNQQGRGHPTQNPRSGGPHLAGNRSGAAGSGVKDHLLDWLPDWSMSKVLQASRDTASLLLWPGWDVVILC